MSNALPNLQQLELGYLGYDFSTSTSKKFADGEEPDENKARNSANAISYDIDMISNFTKLRVLKLDNAPMNGSYPFLFNFPLLSKLTVSNCDYLKLGLGVLAGFPLLKEFRCQGNTRMTGNVSSLRVLKDTLEKVIINNCPHIEGNFMDLADFPQLKFLNLHRMKTITGDIRGMGATSFPKLESLGLPENVYGGDNYKIMRVSDSKVKRTSRITAAFRHRAHR